MSKLWVAILLGFCWSSLSCFSKRPNDEKAPTPGVPQSLLERAAFYCDSSLPTYQKLRYVHSPGDGAAFTSLYKVACGTADLSVFDGPNGHLYRDPEHVAFVPGSDKNFSKSDSSKDMVLMRMVAAWHDKDVVWVERFIKYAESRNFVICDAEDLVIQVSRCTLSTFVVGLLYDMREVLNGRPRVASLADDELKDDGLREGFEAHLQMLRIYLSGQVREGLTDDEINIARLQSERQPRNALYSAIYHLYGDGDQQWTYVLLEDPGLHPHGILPNNHDHRCEEYLYQRDESPGDWAPCKDKPFSEHSGTDLAFVIAILKRATERD